MRGSKSLFQPAGESLDPKCSLFVSFRVFRGHPCSNTELVAHDVRRCARASDAGCSARFMGDFTLTFLGTGTSHGIPVMTCDCAVCHSTDPRDRRTRASAYVETPECAWVIDTGPDFRQQALR